MKNNLFIVESPFQFLSAIEANNYFKNVGVFIVKYNGELNNKLQIKKMIELFKVENIIEIETKFSNFDANIQLLWLLKKLIKNKKKFINIFIGEYRSFHMRKFFDYFPDANSYCLDDGNITIEINNYIKLKKDQYYFEGLKGNLKKIIYSIEILIMNLYSEPIKRDINLFTCFDVDLNHSKNSIKHYFEYIKLFNNKNNKNNKNNIVYFYGSNLELMGIKLSDEIKLLKKIKQFYSDKNIEIIYLPHRRESKNKINYIENILKLRTKCSTFPAEIEMVINLSKPKHISSLFSSVLMTLPLLNTFESTICFSFPLVHVKQKYYEELLSLKNEYQKYIKIIELEYD
jgi:hypothetical protein